ncbi:MAG: hypothetical protein PHD81_02850 [Candidatus Nanoarchaeia archaeon]|nr:hypothetical protein [Candidatus Nanoarchaeia archaeon]MDD5588023.1 hypothetical protein [Candidatus Nanoarchaeia archaeon]
MTEQEIYNMGWGLPNEFANLYYDFLKEYNKEMQRQMTEKAIKKLGGLEVKLPSQSSNPINFKQLKYIAFLPRRNCNGHC